MVIHLTTATQGGLQSFKPLQTITHDVQGEHYNNKTISNI